MSPFTLVEASLKTTATPSQVAKLIWRLRIRENFDLLVTTELGKWSKKKVRQTRIVLGNEYRVAHKGEYMYVWRKGTLDFEKAEYHRLTSNWGFGQSWRDLWVAAFWFTYMPADIALRVEAGHLPSGVESGSKYTKKAGHERFVKTHKDGLRAWRARLTKRADRVAIFATGDFNVNFKVKDWRDLVEKQLELKGCWGPGEVTGSHGRRLIDATFSNATVVKSYVSDVWEPAVFDHEQIVTKYNLDKLIPKAKLIR